MLGRTEQVEKEAAVGWQVLNISILRDYLHLSPHTWRLFEIYVFAPPSTYILSVKVGLLCRAEQVEKEAAVGWQVLHISILRDYLHLELQVFFFVITLKPRVE